MVPSLKSLEALRPIAENSRYSDNADEILQCVRFEMLHADAAPHIVGGRLRRVEQALEAIDKLLDLHGVECIQDPNDWHYPHMEYVNTGDTYCPTIVYDHHSGRFMVTSWGDWLEAYERRNGRIGE